MNKSRYYVAYSHAYMAYVVKDGCTKNEAGDRVVPDSMSEDWQGAQVIANNLNEVHATTGAMAD